MKGEKHMDAKKCSSCRNAVFDSGKWLCMGVQPIAFIDDVSDDDCPKHRATPEALDGKKRPGRKPKAVKEPRAEAVLPDTRTDPDRSGQALSDPAKETPTPESELAEADPVHHPGHYAWRGGLECIEIARELCRGSEGIAAYLIGCAVKYVYRYPRKNGLQDLDKAIECLTMLRDIEARGQEGRTAKCMTIGA